MNVRAMDRILTLISNYELNVCTFGKPPPGPLRRRGSLAPSPLGRVGVGFQTCKEILHNYLHQRLTSLALMCALIIGGAGLAAPGAASQIVRLSTAEREPYIGLNLPNYGYVHELVTEAFQRVGYQVDIAFYPWARAVMNVERGQRDGLLPVYYDDALARDMVFSDPFPGGKIGLLKKKTLDLAAVTAANLSQAEILRRLRDYTFGVVRGSVNTPEFDAADFLRKDFVTTDAQNLLKVFKGRVDVAVIDKYTAADLMVNALPHLIGQLEFVNPPLAEKSFQIAFSRHSPGYRQRVEDFNRGLRAVTADGTLERILYKHGLLETPESEAGPRTLRIGTVDNPEMVIMQRLSAEYEAQHPGIKLEWRVLDENILRLRLLSDLAIADGQFDIMTIGMYETPIWAEKGWLVPLRDLPEGYDLDDVLKPLRDGLSFDGTLYALPFYAESAMTYYRADLFAQAGLTMPDAPTYDDIKRFAAAIHDPANGVSGICQRGKPGWGENMAYISMLVNAYGGRWFDEAWNPAIDSPEWLAALTMYADLAAYGPPNMAANGFTENLALFASGRCGIWVDATVAGGMLFNPRQSRVADALGFAAAPTGVAPTGATAAGSPWLWTWALAMPSSVRMPEDALKFIAWATSRAYIEQVAEQEGWVAVPPGTRQSTYQNPAYQAVAPFADFVLSAIRRADPTNPALKPVPYIGIQYVGIPEFPAIGTQVGQRVARLLSGDLTVAQVLADSQSLAADQMRASGYLRAP
jgi:sorbitol/mannitol transport system substrate-binding protein